MSGKQIHEHDALLNAYIDRELDRAQEEELYAELAQSDELRSRLKQMQTVRSESRNYLAGLAPSAALTDKVFSGLGFRIPEGATPPSNGTGTPPAAAGSGAGTTTGNLFLAAQKLWIPITAAVITATVTTVVLFNVLQDSGTSNAGSNATPGPQIEANEPSPTPDAGSLVPPVGREKTESTTDVSGLSQQAAALPPAVEDSHSASNASSAAIGAGRNATEEPTAGTKQTGSAEVTDSDTPALDNIQAEKAAAPTKKPAVDPTEQSSSSPAALDRSTKPKNTVGNSPALVEKPADRKQPFVREVVSLPSSADPLRGVALDNPPNQEEPPQIIERPREEFAMPWNAFTGFSLHWRLVPQGISSPNVSTAETYGAPSFNNMTLALYYSPSAHHAWGVEFAQEPWHQEYSGQIRDRRLTMQRTVTQNYRTWSLIARYRYTTDPILGSEQLTLFGDLGAGFTRDWWAVTRGTVGMQYNVFGNLNITAGADAGGLFYTFDGTQFSTWKLGGTFGLSLGF